MLSVHAIYFICVFTCLANRLAGGSDASLPHFHTGRLTPFDGKKIELNLEPDEEAKLISDGFVVRKTITGSGGRGIVVQDINASVEACIRVIKDVDRYTGLVPHVLAADVYDVNVEADGISNIKAKMKAGMLGFNYEYFLHLIYRPHFNTITWTLDYTKRSDIDDSVGHWQVESHPHNKGWARVFYSTELALPKYIPSMVINYLTKNVLSESTQWVKIEAEKYSSETSYDSLYSSDTDGSSASTSFDGTAAVPVAERTVLLYKYPRFGFMARTKKWLFRQK